MSSEQRAAAIERLAAAREKRLRDNPPQHLSLHESLRNLPETDPLHPKKVRGWIKTQKDLRAGLRKEVRLGTKGAEGRFSKCDGYIKNMERYLRNGEWLDLFFGEYQTSRMGWKSVALAYHLGGKYDGMVKRSEGIFYPDLGLEWTREMSREYYK